MKIYRLMAILVAGLIITSLAGCKRPIPSSTDGTEPTVEGVSLPVGGPTDVFEQIYLFATQTAIAIQGITTPVPSSLETSNPSIPGSGTTSEVPASAPTLGVVEPPPAATPLPMIAFNPTPGIPSKYSLHTGEFPYCIARRFNVDPGVLLNTNGLTTYSVYYNGMELTIPQIPAAFQAAGPPPSSRNLLRSG